MTELEKLLAEPNSQNWNKIVANLDATMDEALLQEKIELCVAELEKWPDKFRKCPEEWESNPTSSKYLLLPRVFPFPDKADLVATFIQDDNYDDIPFGEVVCLALHFNKKRNKIVALYTENNKEVLIDQPFRDYILIVDPDTYDSQSIWVRPRRDQERHTKSKFIYLCDDGTILVALGIEWEDERIGGEEILIIREGKVVKQDFVRAGKKGYMDPVKFPVDTLFLITENQHLLFWFSSENQIGRLSLHSLNCLSHEIAYKSDWIKEIEGKIVLGTRYREMELLDHENEGLDGLYNTRYSPTKLQEMVTFTPIDDASKVVDGHWPAFWRAAFRYQVYDVEDGRTFWQEKKKICFRASSGPDYFIRYQMQKVGDQTRFAFQTGDPDITFQVGELPSERLAVYGQVFKYHNFPFCFGRQEGEIFIHDSVDIAKWKYQLK